MWSAEKTAEFRVTKPSGELGGARALLGSQRLRRRGNDMAVEEGCWGEWKSLTINRQRTRHNLGRSTALGEAVPKPGGWAGPFLRYLGTVGLRV